MFSRIKITSWLLASIALLLVLTGCGGSTPTPDVQVYTPECDVSELIQAINDANGDGVPSEIQLPANCVYTLTAVDNTLTIFNQDIRSGLPKILSDITIRGNDAVIDIQPGPGEYPFGHFYLGMEHELDLYDLTLSNGARPVGGSIASNEGDLFVYNVKFLNNIAYPGGMDSVAKGGAIYSQFGRVRVLAGSLFQGNMAGETLSSGPNLGGAIYAINANLVINNSFFVDNYAAGNGGAVYNRRSAADLEGGLVTVQNTEFTGNNALQDGGAFYFYEEDGGAIIVTSLFMENEANRYGGAIFSLDSDLEASHSEFVDNQAEDGGAVYLRRSAEGVLSSYVSDHSRYNINTAAGSGGAIFSENADLEMEDTIVGFNQAADCGGIQLGGYPDLDVAAGDLESSLWMNASVELDQCSIFSNQALSGMGGGVCQYMGELSIKDSDLESNQADSYGGGLISLSELAVSGSSITGNQAYRGGGLALGFPRDDSSSFSPDLAYFAFSSTLLNSNVSDNAAQNAGGGIWANHGGSLAILKSAIGGNTAAAEGGGIYQDQGRLYLTNTTLAENTAWRGGGLYTEGTGSPNPELNLTHVTVAYNLATDSGSDYRSGGGGLNLNGTVYIDSSLVVLNTSNDCDLNQGMQGKGDYAVCDETYCAQTLLNVDSDGSCGFDNPAVPSPQLGSFNGTYVPFLAGSPLIDSPNSNILCNAADDQLGTARPQGAGCEPGSIEYVATSPPPPPPQAPEPTEEASSCDPFAGMDISVVTLAINPQNLSLPVYLRFPGDVPDLPEDGSMPYWGKLGQYEAYLVNQQGFEDRLYFLFYPERQAGGSVLRLEIYKEGCSDPVYVQPLLTIPDFPPEEEPLTCRKDLGPKGCAEAGGIWIENVDKPFCHCPGS